MSPSPNDDPFDGIVRHYVKTVQTQAGIIKYAEAMAQVLAEAGRASEKATGDAAWVAVNKWAEVIRKRAQELLRDPVKQLEAPTIDANARIFRETKDQEVS